MQYAGIPLGNVAKASRLTIPGSMGDVARYRYAQGLKEGNAIMAVNQILPRFTADASRLPYHQQLATDIYNVKLNGLGDGDEQMPPTMGGGSINPSSSGWFGVLNTVVGNVSQGLVCKLTGTCKSPSTPIVMQQPSFPFGTVAAVGGAGLLLYMLLRRKAA